MIIRFKSHKHLLKTNLKEETDLDICACKTEKKDGVCEGGFKKKKSVDPMNCPCTVISEKCKDDKCHLCPKGEKCIKLPDSCPE